MYVIKRSVTAETDFHLLPARQRSVLDSAVVMECVMIPLTPTNQSVPATLDLVERTAANQHVALQTATATESANQDGATAKKAFLDLVVPRVAKKLPAWPLHKRKTYVRLSSANALAMETAMS